MNGHLPEGIDDDFVGGEPERPAALPSLGVVGWLRWGWRQLTSMRVALLLLMALAVAAVPGAMLPQRPSSPDKVATYLTGHARLGHWLDRLGFFDVYASPWFAAIYLLLFVSLVGCILPRSRAHLRALRGRPPRTPARFDRFPAHAQTTAEHTPEQVVRAAAGAMRRPHLLPLVPAYRTDVHDEGGGVWSVGAERGYLRETGNLLFHLALVGVLVTVALGQLLHYRGQVIVIAGHGFANAVSEYDTFEHGAWSGASALEPYTLRLDSFSSSFDPATLAARDFTADVTLTEPGQASTPATIKVNHPLEVDGAEVYLQGNGYAPDVVVKDSAGKVAASGPVVFLPQDKVYTSQGVIKAPDVTAGHAQVGLVGYLLPTALEVGTDTWTSVNPEPTSPLLVLTVWTGDLGLDSGVPQNAYRLNTAKMTEATDGSGVPVTIYLRPGETVQLPDGAGSVTFSDVQRYVALDVRYDPTKGWVLGFALAALAGLAASLFAPRRRIWVRASPGTGADGDVGPTVVRAAGLARGDDLGLDDELSRVLTLALGHPPDGPPSDETTPGRPQPAGRSSGKAES